MGEMWRISYSFARETVHALSTSELDKSNRAVGERKKEQLSSTEMGWGARN
jgi:hypothetical protein